MPDLLRAVGGEATTTDAAEAQGWFLDAQGLVRYQSPSFVRLLGYDFLNAVNGLFIARQTSPVHELHELRWRPAVVHLRVQPRARPGRGFPRVEPTPSRGRMQEGPWPPRPTSPRP